jgi:hypothetical protein
MTDPGFDLAGLVGGPVGPELFVIEKGFEGLLEAALPRLGRPRVLGVRCELIDREA